MRRTPVLLGTAFVALGLVPAAAAKWCVRITANPARPVAGAAVTLRLQTFETAALPEGGYGPGRPIELSTPLQMLLAQPQRGDFVSVYLRRRRDDGSLWEARFVFPHAGVWRLRAIDETPLVAGCRGRVRVRVIPG